MRVGHVALPAQADGHRCVGGRPPHRIILPIALVKETVFVQVLHLPIAGVNRLGHFVFGKLAVAVLVVELDHLGEGRKLHALAGFATGGPSVEVQRIAFDDRDGLHLVRQTADAPGHLAGRDVVGIELIGAGHDELVSVCNRCGKAVDVVGAISLPKCLPRLWVDGEQKGALVLIADEEELAVGEDGRSAHAVEVREGAEGNAPTLHAVGGIGEQSVAGEEDVDVGAVADGAG